MHMNMDRCIVVFKTHFFVLNFYCSYLEFHLALVVRELLFLQAGRGVLWILVVPGDRVLQVVRRYQVCLCLQAIPAVQPGHVLPVGLSDQSHQVRLAHQEDQRDLNNKMKH